MEVWVCGWVCERASRSFLALLILYQRHFDKFSIKKTSCILFKDNMLFHSLYTIISQNHEEYHENAAICVRAC